MIEQPARTSDFAPPLGAPQRVPPPPPPVDDRPGRLTVAWQIMVAAGWAAVFFAFAATWKVSEEIGIGTWWLGPRAQPRPLVVSLLPFALALAISLTAIYNVRRVPWISLGGALLVAAIAVFDVSRSGGLAAIEFAIAAGAALISLGAMAGTRSGAVGQHATSPTPQPSGRTPGAPLDPPSI
ncbi:MAG: hypothetical protein HKN44_01235 [Ilumatobacter sp.]|nr:hypothetical protein [Ilumatobacter sp.]